MPRVLLTIGLALSIAGSAGEQASGLRFSISFPTAVHAEPITGRVFVMISRDATPEPRLQSGSFLQSIPLFGADVSQLAPGAPVTVDGATLGYPLNSLNDLPAGDYYAQGLLNVYTEFHRADGHVIWAHMDQWEGQKFNRSPGNLYSDVRRVHLDPKAGGTVTLTLSRVIPPVTVSPDTRWVKHVKIQSKLLTAFWGRPVCLGATMLLPQGYHEHPAVRYPVLYQQTHFGLGPPLGFSTDSFPVSPGQLARLRSYNLEPGFVFYRQWVAADFPRMIVVTFQHPTPYFDDSYAVNSANNGPYGDALLTELIPYLEERFRIIAKPYARVLSGGSTGGWESLALQVFHPDFFGGTWTLYPDPVDFRHYDLVNVYYDTNAFVFTSDGRGGSLGRQYSERYIMRADDGQPLLSVRQFSQLEEVLGSHGRSGEQLEAWEAVYGPVGEDGYPKPLWDKRTGHIDHAVAAYMRDHGYDLRAYLAANWTKIGPQLVDKIHVDVGDMDNFYLNLAVYDLQAFLDTVRTPRARATIRYGRPVKGHGWQHATTAQLLREMAAFITQHAPAGESTAAWKYR